MKLILGVLVALVAPSSSSQQVGEAPFLLPLSPAFADGLGVLAERSSQVGKTALSNGEYACLLLPASEIAAGVDRSAVASTGGSSGRDTAKDAATARSLLSALAGNCSTLAIDRPGGYAYKVCIGVSVHQQAADGSDFLLGNFDDRASTAPDAASALLEHNVQRFANGNPCPGTTRSARVTYFCGDFFGVLSAAEPQMCSYEVNVAHPLLCSAPQSIFPRANAMPPAAPQQQFGASGGGSSTVDAADGAVNPAAAALWSRLGAVARAFPRLRSLLSSRGLDGAAAALRGAAAGANSAAGSSEATAAGAMADVAGVGGASIGLDDRFRSSVHWTGVAGGSGAGGGSRAAPVSWSLQAVAFTANGDHDSHSSAVGARSGTAAAPAAAAAAGAAGAAGRHNDDHDDVEGASCTAYLTDDLRRQGERSGSGVAAGASSIGSTQIVLVHLQRRAGKLAAPANLANLRVSGATAVVRGANRALLASLASDGRSSDPVVQDISTAGVGSAPATAAAAAWELAVWQPAATLGDVDLCSQGATGLGLAASDPSGSAGWCSVAQKILCGEEFCDIRPVAVARRAGSGGISAADAEEFVSLQAQFVATGSS